jgi:ubiquinone/menaquinone biosynthesis C-methylase UbiE
MDNKNFYNSLSSIYDEMIDFDAALKRRTSLLSNIVGPHETAADFGCGTGIDSISLSMLGLKVDAFDQSKEMIAQAEVNASKFNADIQFFSSPLENISPPKKYALIVSLGNTLANLSESKLKLTLDNCNNLLNKNGRLVIQILNYYRVTGERHIVNETENDFYSVSRYYEKINSDLFFKIKIVDKREESEKLLSTKIFPHKFELISEICRDLLFNINIYGDLKLNDFEKSSSKDLVIIGEKN